MKGLVITKNADLFTVKGEDKEYFLKPSGKTKTLGIFVGDKVEFGENITSVLPRKNLLIRPPLANLDKIFIVIASSPKPDFVLVDKMIVYCLCNGIEPIVVINKADIANAKFISSVKEDYKEFKVVTCSAKDNNTAQLEGLISGISAFAGQSAVGKSSLINSLLGHSEKVGGLSKKIERGKQTTRIVKLFEFGDGYIADTAGFSLLDLSFVCKLSPRELSSYYPEFLEGRAKCKYRSCLHEGGECGVIADMKDGTISKNRYENYLKILQELKNAK